MHWLTLKPASAIFIPKYGTFAANLLLGRPYYTTYEVIETAVAGKKTTSLRPVPAAELHGENLAHQTSNPGDTTDDKAEPEDGFDIVADDGQVLVRNNRLTVDDPTRQTLSYEEIEELKRADSSSGKEIIAKIMAAHSALDEKTTFSLAKYTLRKTRKYMKRFTVLPMDVTLLTKFWGEKDSTRIMDLREESLGLIMSWSNVHHGVDEELLTEAGLGPKQNRYLVIDDTGGLVVGALADRLGLLYPQVRDDDKETAPAVNGNAYEDTELPNAPSKDTTEPDEHAQQDQPAKPSSRLGAHRSKKAVQSSALSDTITVLHANQQPNLSLLENFGYKTDRPSEHHPLYHHLRSINWLQLLHPFEDEFYPNEPKASAEELRSMKSGKRGQYYFKRKRWERVKNIVDETREGGFDSLVIATSMDLTGVLKQLVPLVRGGGNIVIYSPNVEPLTEVMDLYSRDRRAGYVKMLQAQEDKLHPGHASGDEDTQPADAGTEAQKPDELERDFPVDPTLLLNPMLQTARAREWQILPMRTHPLMTSRGGCEGYLFTATRVIPVKGMKIEASGKFSKKRRAAELEAAAKRAKVEASTKSEQALATAED